MRRALAAIALSLLLASAAAVACQLCLGGAAQSPAKDFADLPRAVLAVRDGKQFRIVDVIKGERPQALIEDVVVREPDAPGTPLLLVRDDAWPMWVSLGAIDARYAPQLHEFAAGQSAADDATWRRRVAAALPYLESRQPLLAEIAYVECSSAPYAALRDAKAHVDMKALRRWLDDPKLASRRALYVLLVGVAGEASDARIIESRLDAAWRANDATNVGSLLAADLELRGPSRVAWLEDRYLRDKSRSRPEIEAALLALSVQGNSGSVIPRARVIDAYRVFMHEHKDIAGLVAPDLAAWRYWDAAPELAALLESDARQQYASRVAIVAYLRERAAATESR